MISQSYIAQTKMVGIDFLIAQCCMQELNLSYCPQSARILYSLRAIRVYSRLTADLFIYVNEIGTLVRVLCVEQLFL